MKQRQQMPEYKAWSKMKIRCFNKNEPNYHRYGGRGITIHPDWINNFQAFYDHIGPRPSPEHSIDRIDNNGHYEPGNVRWATHEQQAYNKENTLSVQLPSGQVVNTKEAMKQLNMSKGTLMSRLYHDIPLDKPVQQYRLGVNYQGEFKTWEELSQLYGIPVKLIQSRYDAGMDIHHAISMPKQQTQTYAYKDQQLTIPEIAEIESIPDYLIRYHLNKDNTTAEAISIIVTYIKRNYNAAGERLDIGTNHGGTGTPEHNAWNNFRAKCYNSRHPDYKYWGAKGATMCDQWCLSFQNFYANLGPKPSSEHALKIHDRSKPIGPGNASWEVFDTGFKQSNASEIIPLADGRKVTIHEAMAITGLKRKTIYERVRTGKPIEATIRGQYMFEGKLRTAEELAEISGVPLKRLKKRIAKGFPLDKAMTPDL